MVILALVMEHVLVDSAFVILLTVVVSASIKVRNIIEEILLLYYRQVSA